jgi:hypothetical protein
MATKEDLPTQIARLQKHRAHLRGQRLTAWFYKRKNLEAKVYQRLAKLDARLTSLERQQQRRDK